MGMYICVDFDGTVVTHEYPAVGRDLGAERILKRLVIKGHLLILWTMRSGKELQDAVDWYEERGIPLYGINHNPDQSSWTSSPKAYGHLYIDDAALGAPLTFPADGGSPHICWDKVEAMLRETRVL